MNEKQRKIEIVKQIYFELGTTSCRKIAERFNNLGIGRISKSAVQRYLKEIKSI